VSNWQGTIDWAAVANAGYGFAMVKASEGTHYIDPYYAYNRKHGELRGLRIGAYDFGRPSGSTSAKASAAGAKEARYFLAAATPRLGELRPALDIETTGGLDPARLTAWVGGWVAQVRASLGYRPTIYTSPYFWETALADTPTFGRTRIRLWQAQWTSAATPTLPADDWGGFGWAVWQWSDCGSVPGIKGCVDMDVLHPYTGLQDMVMGVPQNHGLPKPTGVFRVGHTLSADVGVWGGPGHPFSYTVYWSRCRDAAATACQGLGRGGAYRLTSADAGWRMRIIIDAHNRYGDTWIASLPSGPVSR
jgi:GH25 family lysozyme M1 (1,4-beta-N-acetylmuramidase)